jgi:hypothetical protein
MPLTNESLKPAEETKLTFHRYGDRYFLAGVQRRGQNLNYELPAGSLEKELRASNVEEKDVTLVASLKTFGK